ncbi:hypothetical protein AWV79_35655 [Cupriavidus sp. UYMMa02A]|nr:hypothetical protein AWV79_35655 [Cupriavidus sp. UYMMa02A]
MLAIWYWGIDGSNCLVTTFLPEVAVGPLGFLFQVTILVMMVAMAAFIGTVVTQAATHIAEPARRAR